VGRVPSDQRREYEIAVKDLGANVLRGGLSAALAAIQRRNDAGGKLLLGHLASAELPGLKGATEGDLAARVRKLSVDDYMLATREVLKVAAWLKRAVQASEAGA
jgi:hypothetical protein